MISHNKNNLIYCDKSLKLITVKYLYFLNYEKNSNSYWTWVCWFSYSYCDSSSKKNYFVYGLEKNHKESIRRIKSLNNSKFPFNTNDVKLKKTLNYIIKEKKNFFCLTDDSVLEKSDYILININFDISKSKNKIRFDLDPFKKTITQIAQK